MIKRNDEFSLCAKGKAKKQQAGSGKAAEKQKAAGMADKRAKVTMKKRQNGMETCIFCHAEGRGAAADGHSAQLPTGRA